MLAVRDISKSFGGRPVLHALTHAFRPGQTTAVVGPSGCGKTTLLRLLLHLVAPDTGRVVLAGAEMSALNAETLRLRTGYVIQNGGLFAHLTARQNVTLMARYLRWTRAEMDARVDTLAQRMHVSVEMLAQYPNRLSGGQRQRIALMRALMLDPEVLLMDEPLGALDPMIRFELQNELKATFDELNKTVVLVTHDMHEAAHFADEIMLMREGRVVQRGTVDELLARPADSFVTDFIRAQRADPRLS